jgi:hypothetical protein
MMAQNYFYWNSYIQRRRNTIRRKKSAQSLRCQLRMAEEAVRRPRNKPSDPRDTQPGFASTQWGKLIAKLKARNDSAGCWTPHFFS